MEFTALLPLLLVVLGAGTHVSNTTTTETTTTETTTTETTTTETTTVETTTTETTVMTPALNNVTSQNTSGNGSLGPVPSHVTAFPKTGNSSAGNATANSTVVPVSIIPMFPHSNISANDSNGVPPSKTSSTANGSSLVPTSPVAGGTVIPTSNTNATANSSAEVVPTKTASVTSQGSTVHGKTPTAVLGSSGGPNPSKAAALPPTVVQLLLRVPLSFRILNRNFSQSLLDPTSKEYRSLSRAVLTMFEGVFGCTSCMGRQTYKGCSELRFSSQGSVAVQSTLVFGHSNDSITSDSAEKKLRSQLDSNGYIMDLQLADIQSGVEVTAPVAQPQVPDWAIALLVLVCVLLLLSILICALLTTCSCRRKSRGKLDLFSTKDSYHPMAEYPPYQSHGRYVSPNSKHNPYSQVAGTIAGGGTFTYTNPSASSDNL
ncbi:mucin-1 isoform X1 [Cygnus olor]|uniref:mucin-1 isoform X1 n=1 Tax=Cygnus olor TaxID=8869 RepID=UPI001ADEA318|nr:mucin-1 isoform X1 [Cygnus olor]